MKQYFFFTLRRIVLAGQHAQSLNRTFRVLLAAWLFLFPALPCAHAQSESDNFTDPSDRQQPQIYTDEQGNRIMRTAPLPRYPEQQEGNTYYIAPQIYPDFGIGEPPDRPSWDQTRPDPFFPGRPRPGHFPHWQNQLQNPYGPEGNHRPHHAPHPTHGHSFHPGHDGRPYQGNPYYGSRPHEPPSFHRRDNQPGHPHRQRHPGTPEQFPGLTPHHPGHHPEFSGNFPGQNHFAPSHFGAHPGNDFRNRQYSPDRQRPRLGPTGMQPPPDRLYRPGKQAGPLGK